MHARIYTTYLVTDSATAIGSVWLPQTLYNSLCVMYVLQAAHIIYDEPCAQQQGAIIDVYSLVLARQILQRCLELAAAATATISRKLAATCVLDALVELDAQGSEVGYY